VLCVSTSNKPQLTGPLGASGTATAVLNVSTQADKGCERTSLSSWSLSSPSESESKIRNTPTQWEGTVGGYCGGYCGGY
jgi:hypothetical protein